MTIDEIRARAKAATPGPWQWFGNTKAKTCYLATTHSGRRFVLQFSRWGMQSAQPVFQVYGAPVGFPDRPDCGIMVSLKGLVEHVPQMGPKFEVDYRRDFYGIAHPDATFIASARQDVEDLLSAYDQAVAERDAALAELATLRLDVLAGRCARKDSGT